MPDEQTPAGGRHSGVTPGPAHTRVPNHLIELVIPRLEIAEARCLLYIVRRTLGFASPTVPGARKLWDRISLSQFTDGCSSNGYVLDLGAGVTRPTARKALKSLEDHGLVMVSYECPTVMRGERAVGCGWSEDDDEHNLQPEVDERTGALACPRCRRTLSKAYALRTLTPGFIRRFLTATDRDGREWGYDADVGQFYVGQPRRLAAPAGQGPSEEDLRAKLWFPEQMDQIIAAAAAANKSGKISSQRIISGFLEPVISLQGQFPRDAVSYGLDVVIKKRIAAQTRNRSWHQYAKACMQTWTERRHGSKEEAEQAVAVQAVETQLEECRDFNRAGEKDRARAKLQEIITGHLDGIAASEFEGDRALARRHILEAFKRGTDDYRFARDIATSADWLPEWNWETDEERAAA